MHKSIYNLYNPKYKYNLNLNYIIKLIKASGMKHNSYNYCFKS